MPLGNSRRVLRYSCLGFPKSSRSSKFDMGGRLLDDSDSVSLGWGMKVAADAVAAGGSGERKTHGSIFDD